MDPRYAERYRALHERHWWWRAREKVVCRELDRLRPPEGWKRALDVGCGDGLFFGRLRDYAAHVEGVEPDAALVTATERDGGRIHVRPFDASFRPSVPFDLMLFLDVLEHIEDAGAAVDHAASILEPGGVVIVTVPAYRHLWTTHDDLNRHVTRYTPNELSTLLGRALVVESVRTFFRWVHAAKLVQRVSEAVLQPKPASPEVPPAPINRMMYGLSRLEERMTSGLNLPIGSSLLAIARKR